MAAVAAGTGLVVVVVAVGSRRGVVAVVADSLVTDSCIGLVGIVGCFEQHQAPLCKTW